MADDTGRITARIVLRAVLPVIKVLLEDDPKTRRRFERVTATVQFAVGGAGSELMASHIIFNQGAFEIAHDLAERPDLVFRFSSYRQMNALFSGKPALPRVEGVRHIGLLLKMLAVLMRLKLLMPGKMPKTPEEARLKIKLILYMVSTALSQLNRAGDPEMTQWTRSQPDRVYQWSVEPEGIACYLRVKAGKTKAGRGFYIRRAPFVHMKFNGIEGALPVLTNRVDTVQAITRGLVENIGSPEYGGQIGDFMLKIARMLT
ncbi:MAG TPA: hypothetical protein PLD73_04420 [Candidatus Hydrogenedentes bacterium]|jgi:hypothetical protein|nr:hypothetical protein [Candidatus Hydrogenedentota bacterium]HPJ97937.1 hypothetical protein [Candidatus Hydrogenedentota bacterium]